MISLTNSFLHIVLFDHPPRHRACSDGDIVSHILHLNGLDPPQFQYQQQQQQPYISGQGYNEIIDGDYEHSCGEEESKILSKSSMVLVPSGIEASWREFRSSHHDPSTTSEETIDKEDYVAKCMNGEETKRAPTTPMSSMKSVGAPHAQSPSLSLSSPALKTPYLPYYQHHESLKSYNKVFELRELQRIPSVDMLAISSSPVSPESIRSRTYSQLVSPQSQTLSSNTLYFVKFGLTALIFLVSILPSIAIPGVSNVWTFIGSLISPVVAFIVPSASYLTFCTNKNLTIDCNYILSFVIIAIASSCTLLLTIQNIVLPFFLRF